VDGQTTHKLLPPGADERHRYQHHQKFVMVLLSLC
jgi:hypothetical protein